MTWDDGRTRCTPRCRGYNLIFIAHFQSIIHRIGTETKLPLFDNAVAFKCTEKNVTWVHIVFINKVKQTQKLGIYANCFPVQSKKRKYYPSPSSEHSANIHSSTIISTMHSLNNFSHKTAVFLWQSNHFFAHSLFTFVRYMSNYKFQETKPFYSLLYLHSWLCLWSSTLSDLTKATNSMQVITAAYITARHQIYWLKISWSQDQHFLIYQMIRKQN